MVVEATALFEIHLQWRGDEPRERGTLLATWAFDAHEALGLPTEAVGGPRPRGGPAEPMHPVRSLGGSPLNLGGQVLSLEASRETEHVAVLDNQWRVHLIDVAAGRRLDTWVGDGEDLAAVAGFGDGDTVLALAGTEIRALAAGGSANTLTTLSFGSDLRAEDAALGGGHLAVVVSMHCRVEEQVDEDGDRSFTEDAEVGLVIGFARDGTVRFVHRLAPEEVDLGNPVGYFRCGRSTWGSGRCRS